MDREGVGALPPGWEGVGDWHRPEESWYPDFANVSVSNPAKEGGGESGRVSTGDVDLETDDSLGLRNGIGGRYGERNGMDKRS